MADPALLEQVTGLRIPALAEHLRACRDTLDAPGTALADVGVIINRDPGLATHFFRHINKSRLDGSRPLISTIESSLNLLGETAIRNLLEQVPVLEEQVTDKAVLQHWYRLIVRSRLAAEIAADWGRLQNDRAPSELMAACTLLPLGEYLLALLEPASFLACAREELAGGHRNTCELERLGIRSRDLGREAARAWGLPQLLQEALDPAAMIGRAQNVVVAYALASAADVEHWRSPAVEAAMELASGYLNRPLAEVSHRVHQVAAHAARQFRLPGVIPPAAKLLWTVLPEPGSQGEAEPETPPTAEPETAPPSPAAPDIAPLKQALTRTLQEGGDANALIRTLLERLHEDYGFERSLLLLPDPQRTRLNVRHQRGFGRETAGLFVDLVRPGLFRKAMEKQQLLWIRDENYPKVAAGLPERWTRAVASANFLLLTLGVGERTLGVIYLDQGGRPIPPELARALQPAAKLLARALQIAHERKHQRKA
ncbi:MAG: HDOD domain-containing protein [Gammaproteobacteria bacterium]|nr:MAG: HDOD domain-containing protein [Gammaproteobacteria bacterium]